MASTAGAPVRRSAVFLDRDGTIIEDVGFIGSPDAVRLIPGAAEAIRRLTEAGHLAIIATNQSGIARGKFTEADYRAVNRQTLALLAAGGATIEADYFCPHLPDISGPCECRKPGTLLYRQAAERFGIDFRHSWWVGDRLRDIEPARALGGRGILVETGLGLSARDAARAAGFPVTRDITAAAMLVVGT